ncbi:MAG: uridine kinase family protein [Eubacteriales bacterium]|jgi:uridine kinase
MKAFVIGISGASASGKSTLCEQLMPLLGENTSCILLDKFYKKELPRIISPLDGKEYPDWNHPDSIDRAAAYDFIKNEISSGFKYLILDGAFLFCIDELCELCDYKIYVTATIETRLYRRIKRNLIIKNQTLEQIADYYLATVRYREREYSIPSSKYADLMLDNENGFGDGIIRAYEAILKTERKIRD